jgi:hypothetical protein
MFCSRVNGLSAKQVGHRIANGRAMENTGTEVDGLRGLGASSGPH